MSVSGTAAKASLNSLLKAKKKPEALALIEKGNADLHEIDAIGYSPIHWAAINGAKTVLTTLIKKGINPFTPDKNGFSPFYHARIQKQERILKVYHENYPLMFPSKHPISLSHEISHEISQHLQDAGLCSFSIKTPQDPQGKKSPRQHLISFFRQVFASEVVLLGKNNKTNGEDSSWTFIDPSYLMQIACGLGEEIALEKAIEILTGLYPLLDWNAQLACIYFIKELVCYSTAEQIGTAEFASAFKAFIKAMNSEKLIMQALMQKLNKLYTVKLNKKMDYHQSALFTALDLNRQFAQAIIKLTPAHFGAKEILAKEQESTPFQDFSALSNRLSEMVCMDILLARNTQESVSRLTFYLDVIGYFLKEADKIGDNEELIYNFAGAFAIYNGLTFNVVDRLKETQRSLAPSYQQKLIAYRELFSTQGSFKKIRQLMNDYPQCIPVVAVYSGDKDKISQNTSFLDRVSLYGKLNVQYNTHYVFLSSLPGLLVPAITDFEKRMAMLEYNERQAYWHSYQLVPAKIIVLDAVPTPKNNEIINALRYCRDVVGPLVVSSNGELFRSESAKEKMLEFLALQAQKVVDTTTFKKEETEIIELCDEIIQKFDATSPAVSPVQELLAERDTSLSPTRRFKRRIKRSPVEPEIGAEAGAELSFSAPSLEDTLKELDINDSSTRERVLSKSQRTFSPLSDDTKLLLEDWEEPAVPTKKAESFHHRHKTELGSPRPRGRSATMQEQRDEIQELASSSQYTPLADGQALRDQKAQGVEHKAARDSTRKSPQKK